MRIAPGINHWIPLPYGSFRTCLHNPLGFLLDVRRDYGDVFRYRVGPFVFHFLFAPEHVEHVLHTRQSNYQRGRQYRLVGRLMGRGLVTTEGDEWKRQRKLAQAAFQTRRLAQYVAVMNDAVRQMLVRWDGVESAGEPIDVAAEMSRLALAIAGRTLFSHDLSQEADAVGQAFGAAQRYVEWRLNRPLTSLPLWAPTPRNRRFRAAVRTLDRVAFDMIARRRSGEASHSDLLASLLTARDDETGIGMTDRQLRDELLTFLIAGHETTAVALAWTWQLLAQHPTVMEQIRDEAAKVLGNRDASIEDVGKLSTARMAVEEAMRLYPPIWAVVRTAMADDVIAGYRIPAGSTIVLSPWVTHRHPQIWERANEFIPERFATEEVARRPAFAYFPFLGGPHRCIGREFAMLEMTLAVAGIASRFQMRLAGGEQVEPAPSLSLRPAGAILMALEPAGGSRPPQATADAYLTKSGQSEYQDVP